MSGLSIKTPADTKAPGKSSFFLPRRELAVVLVSSFGFFIGRAVIFSLVNPLAAAFLAVFMGTGYPFYLTAFFTTLGLIMKLKDIFMIRYLLAITLMCGVNFLSGRLFPSAKKMWTRAPIQALTATVCMLTAGIGTAVFYGRSTYLLLTALLECILAGSLTLIVKRASLILLAHRRRSYHKGLLSGEDLIALAIVMGGVIAGASDIYIGDVSLRFFLCLYVLFIVAYKGGAAMGGTGGMLLGFVLSLAGYWDISMGIILGLAGLGGGFFRKYGRLAVMAGTAVVGLAAVYFLLRSILGFPMLYELICAGLAFMLTPQHFHFNVASALGPVMDSADDYMDKIKEETTRRLDNFAMAFEKLAATFSGLSKPKTSLNKNDVSHLIDDLAARACSTCPKQNDCWEESFYQTYQQVFALLDICGKNGSVRAEDAEAGFFCIQPEHFINQLNIVFSLYKTDLQWNNRIAESRELVSQQLYGVSGIIRRLSGEIDISLNFHEGLEEEMITALLKNKVEVSSVIVLENKAGKYQVTVSHKPCGGRIGKKKCTQDILPVISAVLKRKMQVESDICMTRKGVCSTRFVEEQRLRVTSGVARRAKNKNHDSGDSYSFMELKNGQCLLVLSDGMGSGAKARQESAATVELLEDFIESGFDKELAVKMINSVLVLKSSEESFATLDICAVDLYTGDAEFIKIGAASTFLLRNGKVSILRSSSLPMGMLNEVDLEVSTRKLMHNDVVVMVTDGVTEAAADGKESWISEALPVCRLSNPQDVADYIMEEAERRAGALLKDDMTVLAARIWDKR